MLDRACIDCGQTTCAMEEKKTAAQLDPALIPELERMWNRNPGSVTMEQIADRIRRMGEQRDKFAEEHSIHMLSANLVTCTNCESKIAKDYVEGEMCPVCGNDLRSPYIPAQITT